MELQKSMFILMRQYRPFQAPRSRSIAKTVYYQSSNVPLMSKSRKARQRFNLLYDTAIREATIQKNSTPNIRSPSRTRLPCNSFPAQQVSKIAICVQTTHQVPVIRKSMKCPKAVVLLYYYTTRKYLILLTSFGAHAICG